MSRFVLLLACVAAGCGQPSRSDGPTASGPMLGDHTGGDPGPTLVTSDGGSVSACADPKSCYTVYAHADHDLYSIDLSTKKLTYIGPFNAPKVMVSGNMVEDVITDLAVAPDNTLYVISRTALYKASAQDGHVTAVGPISACGMFSVALTTTPDGNIYTADYSGAFCRIDPSTTPPTVKSIGSIGGGMAVAGDLVAVADGTIYATAYKLSDTSGGTQNNNLLVQIDPATGASIKQIGSTGYAKLFGVAFAMGEVFGFTHDGTGDVVTIDPKTGVGTLFNKFMDSSGHPISFAGAGVNSMVAAPIQ